MCWSSADARWQVCPIGERRERDGSAAVDPFHKEDVKQCNNRDTELQQHKAEQTRWNAGGRRGRAGSA